MMSKSILALGLVATTSLAKQLACNPDDIPIPKYFGTKVTSLMAKEMRGFMDFPVGDFSMINYSKDPLDFCNVTITYTHPGQGDEVNVYLWLPLEGWNGNFFAQGGGGWAAGNPGAQSAGTKLGYATADTDAGHTFYTGNPFQAITDPGYWALTSPGNVNWNLLQNFASVALDDMTHLAKSVVESFYGKAPKYSYWNGCSTGGRQGMMQAQRYPENYNGILSAAPAMNWATFLVTEIWGHVQMNKEKYFPPACELEAITAAAIEACDELDGVKDGVVANHGACNFDALSVAGQKFDCAGDSRKISKSAARIANAVWKGPEKNGKKEWFGVSHEASLTGGMIGGLASTTCDEKNKNCKGTPFAISESWLRFFLKKDPDWDWSAMNEDDFWAFLHQSRQQYTSIMGTDDPDLSAFKAAGGKMIQWHGLADELIFPNGSANYYERVSAMQPKIQDFHRYFEAPGVAHCMGGPGAFPTEAFKTLVTWVEKGKAPDKLDAVTVPVEDGAKIRHRILCPYPKVAAYQGGNPNEASSFKCADSFGKKKASDEGHTEL